MRWRRTPSWSPPGDDEIESIVRANVAIARSFTPERRARLVELTATLLREKRWESVDGIELTDEVLVTIAANAAIPILSFDTWPYRQVRAVIVRPTSVVSAGTRAGPVAGTFTDELMGIAGEAAPHAGPVALAWDAAHYESRHPLGGANVVIHEFAHKIDMNDGYADGVPPLRGEALENWQDVLDEEFHGEEGRESDHVLRSYAWASPAEFFAVSTEAFFCVPARLQGAKPRLYDALSDLYQQDPAAEIRSRPA